MLNRNDIKASDPAECRLVGRRRAVQTEAAADKRRDSLLRDEVQNAIQCGPIVRGILLALLVDPQPSPIDADAPGDVPASQVLSPNVTSLLQAL